MALNGVQELTRISWAPRTKKKFKEDMNFHENKDAEEVVEESRVLDPCEKEKGEPIGGLSDHQVQEPSVDFSFEALEQDRFFFFLDRKPMNITISILLSILLRARKRM